MFIGLEHDLDIGSVRRSGRQADFLPVENRSAPSNGARGDVTWFYRHLTPNGVKPLPARVCGPSKTFPETRS